MNTLELVTIVSDSHGRRIEPPIEQYEARAVMRAMGIEADMADHRTTEQIITEFALRSADVRTVLNDIRVANQCAVQAAGDLL